MNRGGAPLWLLLLDAVLIIGGGALGLWTSGTTQTVGWTAFGVGWIVGLASFLFDLQGTVRRLARNVRSGS